MNKERGEREDNLEFMNRGIKPWISFFPKDVIKFNDVYGDGIEKDKQIKKTERK